jgi:hypothetical protein
MQHQAKPVIPGRSFENYNLKSVVTFPDEYLALSCHCKTHSTICCAVKPTSIMTYPSVGHRMVLNTSSRRLGRYDLGHTVFLQSVWNAHMVMCLLLLHQVVDGNRMIVTPYDLSFRKAKEHAVLCSKQLEKEEVEQFRKVCRVAFHV